MSITITEPVKEIVNQAAFTCVTSLTEGASYNNLRTRADIYVRGAKIATIKQPKGLDDYNFNEILKSVITPFKYKRISTEITYTPGAGSNLLTGFTQNGTFTTWTVSGNTITSAVSAAAAWARTNSVAAVAGDILVLELEGTFAINNGDDHKARLYDGTNFIEPVVVTDTGGSKNRVYWFMIKETGTFYLEIGTDDAAGVDFGGVFNMYKALLADQETYGSPGIHFMVEFSEEYENASGVTTQASEQLTKTFLFIPAPAFEVNGSPVSFDDDVPAYVNSEQYFCTLAALHGFDVGSYDRARYPANFPYCKPGALFNILCLSLAARITLSYREDAGSYTDSNLTCLLGWFYTIVDISYIIATRTAERAEIIVNRQTPTVGPITYPLYIYIDNNYCDENSAPALLEFTGGAGGLDYVQFKAGRRVAGEASKSFYTKLNKSKGPLSSAKIYREFLETSYKDDIYTDILHELINSLSVVKIEDGLTLNRREVGVITDNITKQDGRELISNIIEVEYGD